MFHLSAKRAYLAQLATIGVLATFCCGCGERGEGLIPVEGSVTYNDGSPVTGEMATVLFSPISTADNVPERPASSPIDAKDGTFSLVTQNVGNGAYSGKYKVAVKAWSDYRAQVPAVHARYQDESSTPLEATVSTDNRSFEFKVERP